MSVTRSCAQVGCGIMARKRLKIGRMEHGFMGSDLLQPLIFDFKKNKEQIDGLF